MANFGNFFGRFEGRKQSQSKFYALFGNLCGRLEDRKRDRKLGIWAIFNAIANWAHAPLQAPLRIFEAKWHDFRAKKSIFLDFLQLKFFGILAILNFWAIFN